MGRRKLNPTNHELTGPWAGFRFCRGRLITPEGHAFDHDDLRWLSLTCAIKHEWTAMMDAAKAGRRERPKDPTVVYLRDVLAGARARVEAAKAVSR